MESPSHERLASIDDLETVTSIVAQAFVDDPLWSRALAMPGGSVDHHPAFWRLFAEGALAQGWSWLAAGEAAVALWIPPGATELSTEQEHRLMALARDRLGPGADDYVELLDRFEAAHPRHEEHYYLSLLGTHPDHRGQGIGMALVARNLEQIDAVHRPAYLESSNPANDHRYQRLGFEQIGEISYPGGGLTVSTMWRPAR